MAQANFNEKKRNTEFKKCFASSIEILKNDGFKLESVKRFGCGGMLITGSLGV